MKFAITLLTCGRVDYTLRTLETLSEHNPLLAERAVLLHGDDHAPAKEARRNRDMAATAGFETIVAPARQFGVARMTELLFAEAQRAGADVVLNLQNDWVSERAIPWVQIEQLLADPGIYTVRLYGALKSWTGRCGIHHGGRTPRREVEWRKHPDLNGYEVGDIHWGHPPAATRIEDAVALTRGANAESVSRRRSGDITRLTARTVSNVFRHIGAERTPGFRA